MIIIYNYNNSIAKSFDYIKDKNIISTLTCKFSYKWSIKRWDNKIKIEEIEIPDLSTLSEEEYFQFSLVWDYPFPFLTAYNIINKFKENDYNFNVFENSEVILYNLNKGFVRGWLIDE